MRLNPSLLALLLATSVALTATLLAPTQAHACTWLAGDLQATIPAEGAQAPPDAELSMWFMPGGWPAWELTLVDGDENEIAVDTIHHQYGREVGVVDHYRAIPQTLLEPGEYTLTASDPEEVAYRDDAILTFEVIEDTVAPPQTPENIHWTRIDNMPPDDCYGHAIQWHDVEVAEERDDVWFEVNYDTDGDDIIASHPASHHLRHYLGELVGCFTLEAVAIDGTRSPPVTRCTPDVCRDGGEDRGPLEEVDCVPDESSNDGEEEEQNGDDNEEEVPGEEQDENGQDDEEENSSSCSAGGTTTPASLWFLVLLGGIVAMRRLVGPTWGRVLR